MNRLDEDGLTAELDKCRRNQEILNRNSKILNQEINSLQTNINELNRKIRDHEVIGKFLALMCIPSWYPETLK